MTSTRIVAVAGATGLTGMHLIEALIADPRVRRVIAVTRKPLAIEHQKLTPQIVDFANLPRIPPIDDAYCCLGTTIKAAGSQDAFRKVDFNAVVAFAHATHASGAQRFMLVSSLGASAQSAVFYSRVKGEAEDSVKKMGFAALHIFQPSLLVGERKGSRPGERIGSIVFRGLSPLLIGPARKYRAITAASVAGAMVKVAFTDATGIHSYPSDAIAAMGS